MKEMRQKLALDLPAIHQIRVPGELDESWSDWDGRMTVTAEDDGEFECRPVTTLTGSLDQAALHSLLRRLYSLGLPLLSAVCVECG